MLAEILSAHSFLLLIALLLIPLLIAGFARQLEVTDANRLQPASRNGSTARSNDDKAPAEVITRFIRMLRGESLFGVADSLRPERVDPEMHRWMRTWNLDWRWQATSFLNYLASHTAGVGEENSRWRVALRAAAVADTPAMFDLRIKEQDGHFRRYSVTSKELQELDFQIIASVHILHPLNRELPRFSTQSKSLAAIVEQLTSLADVDYVIQSDRADKIFVNSCLRDRSIRECLELVARSLEWKVTLDGNPEIEVQDAILTFDGILKEHMLGSGKLERKVVDHFGGDRWPSALNTVEKLMVGAAKGLVQHRPVVTMVSGGSAPESCEGRDLLVHTPRSSGNSNRDRHAQAELRVTG